MLASVSGLDFQYVSGATGVASGRFIAQVTNSSGYSMVEIDVNGDQQSDFSAASSGAVQVPGNLSFAANAVKARATNYMGGGPPAQWQPFNITVTPPSNSAPTIASLSFAQGSVSAETANGNLVGTISDSQSYSAQVQFDLDQNGCVDLGGAHVNGIDFTASASFSIGSHTINARVEEYDYNTAQNDIGDWQTFLISILDDSPQINIAGPEAIAEGQEGTFTTSILSPFDESITVTYETQNGTARAGNDYVGKQDQVVIAAGTLSRSFNVAKNSDLESEGDENFIVSIVAVSAGEIQTNTADVLIEDIPIISILANDNTARELGRDTAQFTIIRQGGDLDWTIPIELKIGGSAILKDQYTDDIFTAWDYSTEANLRKVTTPDRRTITLPPGEERKVITIIPVRNDESDADTTVKFEILPPELPIYNVAPSKEATATIFADVEEEQTLLVNGTIKYDGPVSFNNGMVTLGALPLRGAEVQVWDSNSLVADELVGRGFTDDAGKFEIRVNSSDTGSTFGGNADLYLFVLPRSQSSDEVTIGYEVRSYDGELRGIDWKDDIRQGDPGTTITIDKTIPSSEDSDTLNVNGTYYTFPVFDAMYSFARYHATLPGVQKDNLVVAVVKNGDSSYASRRINILRSHRFSWDTIGHEYGHYVHEAAGVTLEPGSHSYLYSNSSKYSDTKATRLAFSEGWATYFSQVAQQNTPNRPISTAGFDDGKATYLRATEVRGEFDVENELGFMNIPGYESVNLISLGEASLKS